MARPRTFDVAVECFWGHDYGATSVRDLGDEMGLGSASL